MKDPEIHTTFVTRLTLRQEARSQEQALVPVFCTDVINPRKKDVKKKQDDLFSNAFGALNGSLVYFLSVSCFFPCFALSASGSDEVGMVLN